MNRLFIILTFVLVAICTAYSQPRENYKTSAKIVKVSQLATNFIKWESLIPQHYSLTLFISA